MDLISQNAHMPPSKRQIDNDGREESNGSLASENELEPEGISALAMSKSKNKRRKEQNEKNMEIEQEEMKRLQNFLFGSLYDPIEFGKEVEEAREETGGGGDGGAFFFVDKSANGKMMSFKDDKEVCDVSEDKHERKPVWVDDEEEMVRVDIVKVNRLKKLRREEGEKVISGADYVTRLRAQHVKLNPGTEWAQLDAKSAGYGSDDEFDGAMLAHGYDEMEDGDILRSNEDVVVKSSTKMLPGLLEYSRLTDANAEDPSNGPINSVQFHRNAQLLLAAGLDKRLRLFQIDGKRNPKIQSIFIEDCPIRKAAFLPDGSQVIIGGRRKFFYSLDVVKAKVDKIGPLTGREEKSLEAFEVSTDSKTIAFIGNEGYILLVSSKTKELIGTLKMNGTARSLAFADEGRQLVSSGGDGHIYHWDLRMRKCFHKGVDEGCISSSALCTSPDSSLFAAGSSSGIVNVYNREEFLGGKRKPLKTIENLVTKVDGLKFNQDAQILAITSSMQKNSLRLVHVPSYTVFSNWPVVKNALQHPRCLDFSPGGGFMAVGNAAGKVFLYKLHHYQHA